MCARAHARTRVAGGHRRGDEAREGEADADAVGALVGPVEVAVVAGRVVERHGRADDEQGGEDKAEVEEGLEEEARGLAGLLGHRVVERGAAREGQAAGGVGREGGGGVVRPGALALGEGRGGVEHARGGGAVLQGREGGRG